MTSIRPSKGRLMTITCAVIGFSLGASLAVKAHSGCDVVSDFGTDYWFGDEHANVCAAGTGTDSMYGYGDNDDLNGGDGTDKLRGAHGDDDLLDNKTGDTDKACDGGGVDYIDLDDSDNNDHMHIIDDGTGSDIFVLDGGDTFDAHSSCPM